MKKILKIEHGRGYFLNEKNDYTVVTELSANRLKQILEIIFNEEDASFDQYDDNLIHNAADKIIYSKVATKLNNIQEERNEIERQVKSEFSEMISKYNLK